MQAIRILRLAGALAIATACAWAAVPARAQTTLTADAMERKQVTVTTIVPKGRTNAIDFTGQVTIASRLARDPELGHHRLVLVFDMSGLSGTQGKTTYRTEYQEEFVKPLAPNHRIEFQFPASVQKDAALGQVVTALAEFALNIDVATGDITSATATISAP